MILKLIRIILLLTILFNLSSLFAQDSIKSQWRGPSRTGVYPNEKLLKKWPADGPKLLWSKEDIGVGLSSPAVTDKNVYINGMIDDTGYLLAYDLKGKLLWKSNYGDEWSESYPGARSTPTVVGDKIYFSNAHTQIICMSALDGKIIWTRNMTDDFAAQNLRWGITESLLISGDKLYCTPGSNDFFMAVLNKNTGKTINTIKAGGKESSYCSPVLVNHNGRDLILTMGGNSVICIDAKSEKMLWEREHETRYAINPNTPTYHNRLYLRSGWIWYHRQSDV